MRQNVRPVQWVAIFLRPARVLEVRQRSGLSAESGVRKTTGELGTRRGVGDPADKGQAREGRARPRKRRGVQVEVPTSLATSRSSCYPRFP